MFRPALLSSLAVIAVLAGPRPAVIPPAAAQEAGGLGVTGPGQGPPPFPQMPTPPPVGIPATGAADVRGVNPARARQTADQGAISRFRGDAGYLAGFQFGAPQAFSRQPPPDPLPLSDTPFAPTIVEAPVFVDNSQSFYSLQQAGRGTKPPVRRIPSGGITTTYNTYNQTINVRPTSNQFNTSNRVTTLNQSNSRTNNISDVRNTRILKTVSNTTNNTTNSHTINNTKNQSSTRNNINNIGTQNNLKSDNSLVNMTVGNNNGSLQQTTVKPPAKGGSPLTAVNAAIGNGNNARQSVRQSVPPLMAAPPPLK